MKFKTSFGFKFKSQYIIYVIVLTGLQIEMVKDANPSGFGYNPTQQLWRWEHWRLSSLPCPCWRRACRSGGGGSRWSGSLLTKQASPNPGEEHFVKSEPLTYTMRPERMMQVWWDARHTLLGFPINPEQPWLQQHRSPEIGSCLIFMGIGDCWRFQENMNIGGKPPLYDARPPGWTHLRWQPRAAGRSLLLSGWPQDRQALPRLTFAWSFSRGLSGMRHLLLLAFDTAPPSSCNSNFFLHLQSTCVLLPYVWVNPNFNTDTEIGVRNPGPCLTNLESRTW